MREGKKERKKKERKKERKVPKVVERSMLPLPFHFFADYEAVITV